MAGAWLCVCAFRFHVPVNPASRYAAIEALIDHRTWAIDETRLGAMTVDKVFWNDHFFSSKPPLLMAILAPCYQLIQAATGWTFETHLYEVVAAMRVPAALLPWLLAALGFRSCLRSLEVEPWSRAFWVAVWSATGLMTAYGGHLDNHSWSAMALMWALAFALRARDAQGAFFAIASGLALGLAVAVDLGAAVSALCMAGTLAYFAWREARWRDLAVFIVAAAAAPLAQAAIQYDLAGTPVPFYFLREAYEYEGSYWTHVSDFDALEEPKWLYTFHALFGHHGLFSVTPWLAVGAFWWTTRALSRDAKIVHAAASLAVVATITYYLLRTANYGGRCVGMRWFMVLHPTLALFAVTRVPDREALRQWAPVLGLLIIPAAFSALTGAINPWEEGWVHAVYRAFGMDSL